MSRAALLPAGSDPFLLAYWLRNFATWAQYVDELRIAVCGKLEDEPLAYIRSLVVAIPKATLYYIDHRIDHGKVIQYLLRKTTADHVLLAEDDAYIRRPEIIDESFRFAEAGGIVGTPRLGFASSELIDAAERKFGKRYAYWPCFLFVAHEHLLATDRLFSNTRWKAGETILDHTLTEPATADTLVWVSYQLHALGLDERLVDNHRLSGQVVPEDAPWFHVGSLSNGHGFMFLGTIPADVYRQEIDTYARLPTDEALRRISWWWRAWNTAEGALPAYRDRYAAGLAQVQRDLGLRQDQVLWYQHNFADPLITWAER